LSRSRKGAHHGDWHSEVVQRDQGLWIHPA
jgi:hypothetical protein